MLVKIYILWQAANQLARNMKDLHHCDWLRSHEYIYPLDYDYDKIYGKVEKIYGIIMVRLR